ncbi:hypothetical protein [Massilia sp. TS11]|uniref:hypothetical protein n=1 Tax=Massilia sp. TS11 TaxID=2908003 RepID=UPI001ED9F8F5|nr:hypothetical protein [Massilia sp. TS11]MCG2586106.1 hypothetical protein [Massilia sp. TS11]
MNKKGRSAYAPQVGDHLRACVITTSFAGLFLSLSGTFFMWAGTDSFKCSTAVWKTSLAINFAMFILAWLVYLPFRKTDKLLCNGLLAILAILCIFWVFGAAMFYFYFLFAPMKVYIRAPVLIGVTASLLHRAYLTIGDINDAFQKNHGLFDRMYRDEGANISFTRDAVGLLEKARRDRNPFRTVHMYAALFIAPFVLVLNRLFTPILGDGHGVFLVTSFLAVPILQWGVGPLVQTAVTMIYYPIKLERETGKQVLLKNW